MAKPISELFNALNAEDQALMNAKAADMLTAIRLGELRKQRGLTQIQVANAMHIKQPTVARMEKRADVQLSTLRNYLQVLGGDLEISAKFPDGTVVNLTT